MSTYLSTHQKLAMLIRTFLMTMAALASCANDQSKAATEQPPPCHNGGISQVRTAEKLVITTCTMVQPCTCDSQEIVFAELKGPKGDTGSSGQAGNPGPRGPAGPMPVEETISWCRHDPTTHRNSTLHIKPSEAIKKYGGYYGALDFSGDCGSWEGKCSCDDPICRNDNPAVHHYFGDMSYD